MSCLLLKWYWNGTHFTYQVEEDQWLTKRSSVQMNNEKIMVSIFELMVANIRLLAPLTHRQ